MEAGGGCADVLRGGGKEGTAGAGVCAWADDQLSAGLGACPGSLKPARLGMTGGGGGGLPWAMAIACCLAYEACLVFCICVSNPWM